MRFIVSVTVAIVIVCGSLNTATADIPTSMNVQGKLTDSTGSPLLPGPKTFTFKIFNAHTGGFELWPVVPGEVQIIETDPLGLWNAQIGVLIPIPDFVFTDTAQWLEITVDDGLGTVETLPRVKLLTSPSAFQSVTSETAAIALMAGPNSVNSVAIMDGAVAVEDIGQNGASAGQILKWNGSQWIASDDNTGGGSDTDWTLTGNVLYMGGQWGLARPGNALYGTHDSGHVNLGTACTTGVSGQHYMSATVGGGISNLAGHDGATVAGGGSNRSLGSMSTISGGAWNSATHEWATVSGGIGHTAGQTGATVGGGQNNAAMAPYATVGGGVGDSASGDAATISGGSANIATGHYSSIGGGMENRALDQGTTVGGGAYNYAHGRFSVIGGGGGDLPADSNSATGDYSTIGGGQSNTVRGASATIGGGEGHSAWGEAATVSGGFANTTLFGPFASVGGGAYNYATDTGATIAGGWACAAPGAYSSIGGGNTNRANGRSSTVGGGSRNYAYGSYSTIAGGGGELPGDTNSAKGQYAVIGGGKNNSTEVEYSTVGGGAFNRAIGQGSTVGGGGANSASGGFSTIAGGNDHEATEFATTVGGGNNNAATASDATVSGGSSNWASGNGSTISGGSVNFATGLASTIGGGFYNTASGRFSVIAGGGGYGAPALADTNTARGDWSTVPGGKGNAAAGHYSLAAGRRAIANHDGAFIWSDTSNSDFYSAVDNEFAINAAGGFRVLATNSSYGAVVTNNGVGDGIRAYANVSLGNVWAAVYASNSGTSPGIFATSTGGDAGYFQGNITVTGSVLKSGGGTKIDHPLDPTKKYLNHSSVESPDMMNVYNGNVITNAGGEAIVILPDYFEALNRDFRYQLTVIGQFAQAIVGEKIAGSQFTVRTDKPNVEVSWQVTGIRQDAFANANRIAVEEVKPAEERGLYLHPKAHGQPDPARSTKVK